MSVSRGWSKVGRFSTFSARVSRSPKAAFVSAIQLVSAAGGWARFSVADRSEYGTDVGALVSFGRWAGCDGADGDQLEFRGERSGK